MEYATKEIDGVNYIEVKDGKPMVKDGDKTFGIDAIGAQTTITSLHAESAGHRKAAKAAASKLEAFGDIDPTAATEALSTVRSLGENHQVEMDKLKAEMDKTYQGKLAEKDSEVAGLNKELFKATVTSRFATSEVVKNTTLPPDIAAVYFGKHFSQDGTAKDSAGNMIYSVEKPGEPASFDEALGIIIDSYPGKETIMRGTGQNGSGGHSPSGAGGIPKEAAWFEKDASGKKGPHYNLTKQGQLQYSNKDLYDRLKAMY